MQLTKIEYLTHSWNPIAMRCTPVSEGCANCWHLRMANRMKGIYASSITNNSNIRFHAYNGGNPWLNTEELSAPLRRKKPSIIGVQFMGDIFHESIPNEWIASVFGVMAAAPQHTFVVLTKRVWRADDWYKWKNVIRESPWDNHAEILIELGNVWPLPNVIMMASAENQKTLEERVRILLRIPAAKRGVSLEPLLGPVDLDDMVFPIGGSDGSEWHASALECDVDPEDDEEWKGATLDIVICGAETGPGKRLMALDWARSVRDQCQAAGVPFFFKRDSQGRRELDGRRWEEMP